MSVITLSEENKRSVFGQYVQVVGEDKCIVPYSLDRCECFGYVSFGGDDDAIGRTASIDHLKKSGCDGHSTSLYSMIDLKFELCVRVLKGDELGALKADLAAGRVLVSYRSLYS